MQHIRVFEFAQSGGLSKLQAPQIPNSYIEDTPEVSAAKDDHLVAHHMVHHEDNESHHMAIHVMDENGNLVEQQVMPQGYIADNANVHAAKKQFYATFNDVELGKHAAWAPVNNDVQAPQIANSYLSDTPEVVAAKEEHLVAHHNVHHEATESHHVARKDDMAIEPVSEPEPMAEKAAMVEPAALAVPHYQQPLMLPYLPYLPLQHSQPLHYQLLPFPGLPVQKEMVESGVQLA